MTNQIKMSLRRLYLNSGGYDSSGAYFGHGLPIYIYSGETESDEIWGTLRAGSRESAKAQIRATYPSATFYR